MRTNESTTDNKIDSVVVLLNTSVDIRENSVMISRVTFLSAGTIFLRISPNQSESFDAFKERIKNI